MMRIISKTTCLFICTMVLVNASGAAAQTCSAPGFTQPAIYPVPSGGNRRVAAADFDGDGRPDLAVLDLNADTVTVFTKLNGISAPLTNSFSTGHSPSMLSVGDFNGDTRPDLVIGTAAGIQLMLNNGGGLFFSSGTFAAPHSGRFVVGDFTGDGRLDLATPSNTAVIVFPGNGQGGFGPFLSTTVTATNVLNLVAADFDGDGKLDLAGTGNPIQILLGKGDGTFTKQNNGCASASAGSDIAAGDVTGDGKIDLVAADTLSATIQVLTGNGSGCFSSVTSFNVLNQGRPGSVTLGDLNNNGVLDIVGGTTVILANGAGGFGAPIFYGSGSTSSNTVLADFDADGKLDLGTAGSTSVGVLFGDGQGGFKFALGPTGGAFGVGRGDFNSDGKPDLVFGAATGVALTLGDGLGNFSPATTFGANFSESVVVGDFNGDTKTDVAALDIGRHISVLLGDGAGHLGTPIVTTLNNVSDPFSIGSGDFNRDGKLDLVALNRGATTGVVILLGDGTGSFSVPTALPVNIATNPKQVAVVDLNSDGKPDLAVPSGFGFSIMLGDGNGGFGAPTRITTANATSIVSADFNGDGKADLAMAGENEKKVSVVLGNGAGGFGAPFQPAVTSLAQDVAVADFDGDGKLDLAASGASGTGALNAAISVFLGDGSGSFSPFASLIVEPNPGFIIAGDYNGDGRNDLVTANAQVNNFTLLLNTCGTPASSAPTIQFGAPLFSVGEGGKSATITVTRTGSTAGAASVDYETGNGSASARSDYTQALGTLRFADGESVKSFIVLITDDTTPEGTESFNVMLSGVVGAMPGAPSQAAVLISENDTSFVNSNPIDSAAFFVRQHYLDFLNREPDQSGLDFWTNQITSCANNAGCTEARRIDVSASFFLSIEFQQTGYLVERFYKTAYGSATGVSTFNGQHQLSVPTVRFNEFLRDTQRIGQGVIVLQPGWEQALENNKQAYALEFVQTARFTAANAFPAAMTPDEFVDTLNLNAGNVLSASERSTVINLFGGAANSGNVTARAQAVRQVADDTDLYNAEYNRAFVLAEYFGYLRRNPNDTPDSDYTGYDFWLTKLNQFNGNYINAEMVKAFLSSLEYRQRFGP